MFQENDPLRSCEFDVLPPLKIRVFVQRRRKGMKEGRNSRSWRFLRFLRGSLSDGESCESDRRGTGPKFRDPWQNMRVNLVTYLVILIIVPRSWNNVATRSGILLTVSLPFSFSSLLSLLLFVLKSMNLRNKFEFLIEYPLGDFFVFLLEEESTIEIYWDITANHQFMTGISYAHSLLSLNIICMCANLTIVPDIVSYLQFNCIDGIARSSKFLA